MTSQQRNRVAWLVLQQLWNQLDPGTEEGFRGREEIKKSFQQVDIPENYRNETLGWLATSKQPAKEHRS